MLSPAERKALKARAHKLEPVVIIGAKGLTGEVVKEIDLALKAHQLVKVRAPSLGRDAREQALSLICQKTGAEPVQQVGKIFVIFRKKPG
jgi:putative YhbY family RNA-binding protein